MINDTPNMIELTPVEEAQSFYSDFYKELHGFRPRFATAEQWNSLEWLEEQIKSLHEYAPIVAAEDAAREKAAIEKFEALVATTIASGAKDRVTAMRWLRDSDDPYVANDDGYFEYTHGLPYGYLKKAA
jgi:hypothetical protein